MDDECRYRLTHWIRNSTESKGNNMFSKPFCFVGNWGALVVSWTSVKWGTKRHKRSQVRSHGSNWFGLFDISFCGYTCLYTFGMLLYTVLLLTNAISVLSTSKSWLTLPLLLCHFRCLTRPPLSERFLVTLWRGYLGWIRISGDHVFQALFIVLDQKS